MNGLSQQQHPGSYHHELYYQSSTFYESYNSLASQRMETSIYHQPQPQQQPPSPLPHLALIGAATHDGVVINISSASNSSSSLVLTSHDYHHHEPHPYHHHYHNSQHQQRLQHLHAQDAVVVNCYRYADQIVPEQIAPHHETITWHQPQSHQHTHQHQVQDLSSSDSAGGTTTYVDYSWLQMQVETFYISFN